MGENGPAGADILLRLDALGGLVRDLGTIAPSALRAAAYATICRCWKNLL